MIQLIRFLAAIVAVLLGVCAAWVWFLRDPGQPFVAKSLLFAFLSAAALGWLLWSYFRPAKVPDFVGRMAGSFFESTGVSFALMPAVLVDRLALVIPFQNRHSRGCRFRLCIRPEHDSLSINRIAVNVLPGGAFGMARIEFPLLPELAGRRIQFTVGATAEYPAGRGELLLFREGLRATTVEMLDLGVIGDLLLSPSTVTFQMPAARQPGPDKLASTWELIWKPGDPPPPEDTVTPGKNEPSAMGPSRRSNTPSR